MLHIKWYCITFNLHNGVQNQRLEKCVQRVDISDLSSAYNVDLKSEVFTR